jgi:hypothetical protein
MYLIHDSHSVFPRKKCIFICLFVVISVINLTSCTTSISNLHFYTSFVTVLSGGCVLLLQPKDVSHCSDKGHT